ncbi:MAG: hypothetical protein A2X46_16430 [Lentisphaerae bacterium GWF2_57_35]|nr:MAG: hypothetical protein A2X46_16430 [Lentisphaerae bacterium GWF2_57_35]
MFDAESRRPSPPRIATATLAVAGVFTVATADGDGAPSLPFFAVGRALTPLSAFFFSYDLRNATLHLAVTARLRYSLTKSI